MAQDHDVKKSAIRKVIDSYKTILPQSVKNPDADNTVKKAELTSVIKYLHQLSEISNTEARKIDSEFIKNHLSVLTKSDLDEYISNTHYTQASLWSWLEVKMKLLPILNVPELSTELETIAYDTRVEALAIYNIQLGTDDKYTRDNAKTVSIINHYNGILAMLDPQIDELLDHTLNKYTEQDK